MKTRAELELDAEAQQLQNITSHSNQTDHDRSPSYGVAVFFSGAFWTMFLLFVLNASHAIDISWAWVVSPFIYTGICVVVVGVVAIIIATFAYYQRRQR